MMIETNYFIQNEGCPFCNKESNTIISSVYYHDTAEANKELQNIKGILYSCWECGIAFPSHKYAVNSFPMFYRKSHDDLSYFDKSLMQKARIAYIYQILKSYHRKNSLSRFLDNLSCHVFQIPMVMKEPKKLIMLDVGCGFGEFLKIYHKLGNTVVGTEIIESLSCALNDQGYDCRYGTIEQIDFQNNRFDVILLRAVLYRMHDPVASLKTLAKLLKANGEMAIVDPCPGVDGAEYFFKKQFPQGQYYILDRDRFFAKIKDITGLTCRASKLIYGRPSAPLKSIKLLGNVIGLFELLVANIFKYKPYSLSYNLNNPSMQ